MICRAFYSGVLIAYPYLQENAMENHKKKALIIDGNILQRKTIMGYIGTQFECMESRSLTDGLLLLREHRFDLVITEFEMKPDGNTDALGAIKRIQESVKVIVMTKAPSEALIFAAIRQGLDGILVKPVNAKVLLQKIEEALSVSLLGEIRSFPQVATLSFQVGIVGPYTVLSLVGKLISSTLATLKAKLDAFYRQGKKFFALNLEKVTEMDQSAFNFLTTAFEYLRRGSGVLCLYNVFNHLRAIMNNNEVMNKLPIYLNASDFKGSIRREVSMAFPNRDEG